MLLGQRSSSLGFRGQRVVGLFTERGKYVTDANHEKVRHVPYADGIGPSVVLADVTDGYIVPNYLCKSLNMSCQTKCNDFNATTCTLSAEISVPVGEMRREAARGRPLDAARRGCYARFW